MWSRIRWLLWQSVQIARTPEVLHALSPFYALGFALARPDLTLAAAGAVFLAVTGGEALYADLGHFGKRPIRIAWFTFVMPALVLNYFGQGAMLLDQPEAIENPFYLMAPEWARLPLVLLATAATVIASQALITAAFSVTKQAVQLGILPRMAIRHTSVRDTGQIYVPFVNWGLYVFIVLAVALFKSSSNLAAAYGIAVTGTMSITTLLFHRTMRDLWRWPRWQSWPLTVAFLAVDLSFFGANVVKIESVGYQATLARLLRERGIAVAQALAAIQAGDWNKALDAYLRADKAVKSALSGVTWDERVLAAVSGGVDSSVAAALVHKAIGDQLVSVFVDTGLLRKNEPEQVVAAFRGTLGSELVAVDAADEFFDALKGVTEPEQKRKIVGEKFIRIFEREAKGLGQPRFLVQGTIYPDVVESAAPDRSPGGPDRGSAALLARLAPFAALGYPVVPLSAKRDVVTTTSAPGVRVDRPPPSLATLLDTVDPISTSGPSASTPPPIASVSTSRPTESMSSRPAGARPPAARPRPGSRARPPRERRPHN